MRPSFAAIVTLSFLLFISCHTTKKTDESTPAIKKEEPTNSAVPVGLGLGNKAPEINEISPEGKPIALSSLQG